MEINSSSDSMSSESSSSSSSYIDSSLSSSPSSSSSIDSSSSTSSSSSKVRKQIKPVPMDYNKILGEGLSNNIQQVCSGYQQHFGYF
jgi:hypothetical protein